MLFILISVIRNKKAQIHKPVNKTNKQKKSNVHKYFKYVFYNKQYT